MSRLLDILRDAGMPMDLAQDRLEGIDIEKEYELIQKKESKLPRMQRDMVEARWKINQELKQRGIEEPPVYYIEEYTKFDSTWEKIFTTFEPALLRWTWKKARERLTEQDKDLNLIRTNMSEEELQIIDPPNLALEGGEYRGVTVERKANNEGVFYILSIGDKIVWRETNLKNDKDLRNLIDGVVSIGGE